MYLKCLNGLRNKVGLISESKAVRWVTSYCGGWNSSVVQIQSVSSLFYHHQGKQGVNSLMCAYRASNGVYLLVFTTVSVGLHAHQLLFNQDHVLYSEAVRGYPGSQRKQNMLVWCTGIVLCTPSTCTDCIVSTCWAQATCETKSIQQDISRCIL